MPSNRATVLCSYHYDALNRLTASAPSAQASVQRFYLKDRLSTEIQGAVQRSIMQHEDQLLAQRERQTAVQTHLLATDQQRSVLNLLDASVRHPLAYTPYGHRQNGLLSLLGFNGERRDPVTGSYLLGNGYRAFNPVLMRFNSPDSWSPFGEGGLNAYAYCVGDPVNHDDRSGHAGVFGMLKFIGRKLGFRQSSRAARAARADRAFDIAAQSHVSIPSSQANRAPAGAPPPYTTEPSTPLPIGASSQTLEAPPPYSQHQGHSMVPPPYSQGNGVTSSDMRRISPPNMQPPPSYFSEQQRLGVTTRPARIQVQLDQLRAHRQRVQNAFRGIPLSESAQATIDDLTAQIRNLRRR